MYYIAMKTINSYPWPAGEITLSQLQYLIICQGIEKEILEGKQPQFANSEFDQRLKEAQIRGEELRKSGKNININL